MFRVKEVFPTIQGEGFHTGTPAIFVRFVGCNMWSGYERDRERDHERTGADCPLWCDTDFTKEGSKVYTVEELADEVNRVRGHLKVSRVVLSGGEPALQINKDLIVTLQAKGFDVSIETNGTVRLDADVERLIDWITISPKLPPGEIKQGWCNELKCVVPDYDPADYETVIHAEYTFVQPEDGDRYAEACELAVQMALEHGYRISAQIHKTIKVK